MLSLDSRLEEQAAPQDGVTQQTPLARKLQVAGLVLLGVLFGGPLLVAGVVFLCWDNIDAEIRRITSQPGNVEPAELDGKALSLFNRKMAAVRTTLEPEPFVTFTLAELNSEVNYLLNTGVLSPALANFRVELEGDFLVLRGRWTGEEMAALLGSAGWSPTNPIYGPVVQYIRRLAYFQVDAQVKPRASKGLFTWDVQKALLHGYPLPVDLALRFQEMLLPRAAGYAPGPTGRDLLDAKVTPQGLLLKWARPK